MHQILGIAGAPTMQSERAKASAAGN